MSLAQAILDRMKPSRQRTDVSETWSGSKPSLDQRRQQRRKANRAARKARARNRTR